MQSVVEARSSCFFLDVSSSPGSFGLSSMRPEMRLGVGKPGLIRDGWLAHHTVYGSGFTEDLLQGVNTELVTDGP